VAGQVCHMVVMFVGEPGTDDHKANMAQGGHGITRRTFVGQVEPMNIRVLGSSVPYGRRA
jgi:hypothetical protein